jgi:pimeloyl-ACP methyl ester carboxylesterase
LIGYSIGGHHALMAAWLDGNPSLAGRSNSPVVRTLAEPELRPQFDGGIFVISPVLNMIDYANSLNTRRSILDSPVRSVFQSSCEKRTKEISGRASYRMWDLMECELRRSRWMAMYPNYPMLMDDNLRFIDFCQLAGPAVGAKRMDAVRVPVLILQAADDPLSGSAQAIADVFAGVENPNCGVVLLKEGGHGGFPALSKAYFYSLMKCFFDPATAPRSLDNYPQMVRKEPSSGSEPTAAIPARSEPLRLTQ